MLSHRSRFLKLQNTKNGCLRMKQSPVIFPLFGSNELARRIQTSCLYEMGQLSQHQFPDEESVIKIESNVMDRTVIFIASLDRPNNKILPLLLAAETARSLGASKVILIAPYLAYMRQDKIFEPGQGITSIYFAKLISRYFDELITIDPHLHRWHELNAIYDIPTHVLHATDSIAHWIYNDIKNPILSGPDAESLQWVQDIAQKADAPFLILKKNRRGDSNVEVSSPHMEQYRDNTPVLIDDIISTGMTMIDTIHHLQALNLSPPICIGVHAVFAEDAYQKLVASGVDKIITCNTIPHVSNGIDISNAIIDLLMTQSNLRRDNHWNEK